MAQPPPTVTQHARTSNRSVRRLAGTRRASVLRSLSSTRTGTAWERRSVTPVVVVVLVLVVAVAKAPTVLRPHLLLRHRRLHPRPTGDVTESFDAAYRSNGAIPPRDSC